MRGLLSYSLVVLGVGHQAGAQAPHGAEVDALVRAAIQGYLHNRESFPYFRCEYTVTDGKANSVADALAGKLTNPITTKRLWIVNGRKVLHRVEADPVIFEPALQKALDSVGPKKSGKSKVSVPTLSSEFLSSGENQLDYIPSMKGATVFAPDHPHGGVGDLTPFGMGLMGAGEKLNPGYLLQLCEKPGGSYQARGLEEIDGKPVVTVTFRPPDSTAYTRHSFDLSRGYLPFRIGLHHNQTNKLLAQAYLTDVREFRKDRWFPERSVRVVGSEAPLSVSVIQVVKLDVEKRPTDQDFVLDLPAGTEINSATDPSAFFRLKQKEQIGLAQLSTLVEMCKRAKTTPRMDTAVVPAPRWSPWLWAGAGCLTALGLAIGVVAVRRWQRT